MIILYILSILWALGCVGFPLWGVFYNFFTDKWSADKLLGSICLFLGLPMGCLLGCLPFALIMQENSPDLATLKKNAWLCSAAHSETTTSYVMVGKVMVPSTNTHNVCDQYNRR